MWRKCLAPKLPSVLVVKRSREKFLAGNKQFGLLLLLLSMDTALLVYNARSPTGRAAHTMAVQYRYGSSTKPADIRLGSVQFLTSNASTSHRLTGALSVSVSAAGYLGTSALRDMDTLEQCLVRTIPVRNRQQQ